jgi:ketosteroid isomerase-like protein
MEVGEVKAIQKVLTDYFKAWNEGFRSKEGDHIRRFMSKDFVGYWAHSGVTQPDPYFYNYDLNSVLKQMDHAEKTFEVRSLTERNEGREVIVVGKETNTINGKPFTAQCMFVWRNEDDEWKLLREYIELER